MIIYMEKYSFCCAYSSNILCICWDSCAFRVQQVRETIDSQISTSADRSIWTRFPFSDCIWSGVSDLFIDVSVWEKSEYANLGWLVRDTEVGYNIVEWILVLYQSLLYAKWRELEQRAMRRAQGMDNGPRRYEDIVLVCQNIRGWQFPQVAL